MYFASKVKAVNHVLTHLIECYIRMPIRLSTVSVVLFLGLLGLFSCRPSDPVVPRIPGTSTPEVDIYACKFYETKTKTARVNEVGYPAGTSEGYSLVPFFDTVYTNGRTTSTYKHTFDSQKFLTKRTASVDNQQTGNSVINSQSETTYQYTSGKLTSALTSFTTSSDVVYTNSQRYTYDADGKVSKYVYTGIDGSTDTQTFEGGILRSYRLVNGQGEVDDRTPYINSQGLLTQVDFTKGSYFSRFSHDSAGNAVRVEEWRQGKLDAYTTNEYGDKSNQASAVFVHKGHPILPSAFWSDANRIIKSAYYSTASGYNQPVKRSESDYVYVVNERGLIVKRTQTTRSFSLDGSIYQTDTTEELYGYRPCK